MGTLPLVNYDMPEAYTLGVVGYCPPSEFDEDEARRMINEGYDQVEREHSDQEIQVAAGLSYCGVLGIAYEEAVKRDWKTIGIAPQQAVDNYELFPVDETQVVGEKFGDESATFVSAIDGLLRVGGGPQSKREAAVVRESGRDVIEFELALITEETRARVEKL